MPCVGAASDVLDSPDLECFCLSLLGGHRRLIAFLELFQAGAVLTEVRLCAHEDDSRQRSEVLKKGEPRLGGVGEAVPLDDGEAQEDDVGVTKPQRVQASVVFLP